MNAVVFRFQSRLTTLVTMLLLCTLPGVAAAFELGEVKYFSSADRFEIRIPVVDIQRDASSKLTGTIYSQSEIVDLLSYAVHSAGENLEFVASTDQAVQESFVFVVEMAYRGKMTGRRYEFNGTGENTIKQQSTSFSLTPGDAERFVPKAKFDLNLTHTTHLVETGQTLWDIAVDCEEIGGNNFQRSLAIFAANQNKFVDGDINHLSVNTTLVIPKQSYVDMFSPTDATSIFYRLATGALAIDANDDEMSTDTVTASSDAGQDVSQSSTLALEMSASREVPTEQTMLSRRIDAVESNIKVMLEEQRTLMREALSNLDRRIEVLESQ